MQLNEADMENSLHNNAINLPTTERVSCRRVDSSGKCEEREEEIVCENELEVSVNGIPAFRLTCTPEHLSELVLGRLRTEGIIRNADEVEHLFICGKGNIAEVKLSDSITFEPYNGFEPTCCTGNRQMIQRAAEEKETVLPSVSPEPADVFSLAEYFRKDSTLHRNTSGTHSCYIRFGDGRILSFEDIGRHNALDKAVGAMLLNEEVPARCMLYTTGRVAEDMAKKVIAAGIPVLVSKAVPTEAAIILAKKHHLKLICRAWPDSYDEYT